MRNHKGASNPNAKLTKEKVEEIRGLKGKEKAIVLAIRYGVSEVTIYKVWKEERWK